jgi:hypothetical protein
VIEVLQFLVSDGTLLELGEGPGKLYWLRSRELRVNRTVRFATEPMA